MSSTSDQTTKQNKKTRLIVGEVGVDTETGIVGKGHSYDNGKTFTVDDTIYGRIYHADDHDKIWKGIQDQVAKVVAPAKSAADSAVNAADDAVASAQVTSAAVSAVASATAEAQQGANEAMSRALSAWDVATGAKSAVTDFDPLLKQAQSDASNALIQVATTANDLSDAKTALTSDVAEAKELANTAQTTANSAVESASENAKALASQANALSDAKNAIDSDVASAKGLANAAQATANSAINSASSVASDLTAVASQVKANTSGITKVTSDVGLLQTTVADNSGNISKIQETASQIQQAVSDNSGNIMVAKQTADSAIAVASDAKSNVTVAVQTASQASITAQNASGQAASAVLTANGAMTTASNANSYATVAIQTASGASLTATSANNDATIAKQTASEANVQASNAASDFAQLSIRANKIEANVATNSGAIASVQQTANGLTGTVANKADQSTVTQLANVFQVKLQGNVIAQADNVTLTYTGEDNECPEVADLQNPQRATEGTKVYLSFDYTADDDCKLGVQLNEDPRTPWGDIVSSPIEAQKGVTGHYFKEITVSDDSWKNTKATKLILRSDNFNGKVTISNLLLTTGDNVQSTFDMLQNDINMRVQKGDLLSQINLQAGTALIQSNKLVLDAGTTVFTGDAFIPSAAIANLTADDIKTGTLTGSTIHLDDSNGNTIDLGSLATNYVGFHSKATNGDQTYIDLNGIYNYGSSYATKISQGKITTNLLTVNGGGLIDFRSDGSGTTLSNQEFQFYNSGSVNGGLSFSGSIPIATAADGVGGNELRVRYDRSFAVTPINDDSARICASPAAMQLGFVQSGSSTPDKNTTGLLVDSNNRRIDLGVWGADSTWARMETTTGNINLQAVNAHCNLDGGRLHFYKDNDNNSPTAVELQVDGWAWVRGWVEAAGHSTHSALSTKTDIQPVDNDKMLKMVNDTDLTTYLYKTDVASGETHRHIGLIIDDVNDVAQYQTPQDFIAPNGVSRDDDNMIGALFGAVKALTKRIEILESKVG